MPGKGKKKYSKKQMKIARVAEPRDRITGADFRKLKQGKRKPVIYNCGHSNCADCFNGWCKSQYDTNGKVSCPYCRQEITKAIRLFVD